MAGSGSGPIGSVRPRKRPFPFGLVMLVFGMGLGFYGGIAATKKAMAGPDWVQRIFGVTPPAPIMIKTPPPAPASGPPTAPPASPPAASQPAPPQPDGTATGGSSTGDMPSPSAAKSSKSKPATVEDVAGSWTTTDKLSSGGQVATAYIFRPDNTGEFDANGQKLYDLKWEQAGDELSLEIDGQGPDVNQAWTANFRWSLNDDRTILTLVPTSGKDPRSFLYSLGPGVYHRKGI